MTIVGVIGVGKAKGVTTIACGLASAAATQGSALLIESDVGGGDIGTWRKVDVSTHSVIEATAAVAVADTVAGQVSGITQYCSSVEGSPECLVLSLRPAGELGTHVDAFWQAAGETLRRIESPVVVDFGRFDTTVNADLWRTHVDVGVVVTNGDIAGLKRLHHLSKKAPVVNRFKTLVVANGSPWDRSEVVTKVPVVDEVLPWEPKAAQAIRLGAWSRARRSGLGRELNGLWAAVCERAVV